MRKQEKESENREQLGSIEPEFWHEFIMPHLDNHSLVNASLSCRFFNQAASSKLGQLRAMLGPRDYSQPFIDNPCDTINRMFIVNEEIHNLTLLSSNIFAIVAYKKIHLIQFKPSVEGGYEFTSYGEIPLASDGIKTNPLKIKLIKLSGNRIVVADDERACVYDWMTGTRLSNHKTGGYPLKLAKTPDGYMILTLLELESKKYQLSHYDIGSNLINSFHFFYPENIHRITMDREGNFLVEGHIFNYHHLNCYTPEGDFCFRQTFVHDDPQGRMHFQVQHPTLFAFTNEYTTDSTTQITLYKRNESSAPELLIQLPLEGEFDNPVFLQNERFFAWEESSTWEEMSNDDVRQLKIVDLETKKIIHNSTISSSQDRSKYTIPSEMISLPNGDVVSIEINHITQKYQLRAFCFPPCLRRSDNLQSNYTDELDDSMEYLKTTKICPSCNIF